MKLFPYTILYILFYMLFEYPLLLSKFYFSLTDIMMACIFCVYALL